MGSFYVMSFGNRVFLQVHSDIVPTADYELYFSQEINLFSASSVPPVLEVKRSFRNFPELFLLRPNAVSSGRLSKQRPGKIKKKKNKADDSPTWDTVLSIQLSTLNSR